MSMRMQGETLFKNIYRFKKLWWKNDAFLVSLGLLLEKWNSSYKEREPLGFCWFLKDYAEIRKRNAIAYERRVSFANSLDTNKLVEFEKDISEFLAKFELGKEWFITIADFILSRWIYPPMFNLNIREDEGVNGRPILAVEYNPDTSKEDVDEAWQYINERKKEYITKKIIAILDKDFNNPEIVEFT